MGVAAGIGQASAFGDTPAGAVGVTVLVTLGAVVFVLVDCALGLGLAAAALRAVVSVGVAAATVPK